MVLFEKQNIKKTSLKEILFAYNYLMRLRFLHQYHCITAKTPLTNLISIKNLSEIDILTLKKIFTLMSNNQTRLNFDFKGNI
jgi:signal-transduction protein with cAMP-binding, CBS, and nucleotidyltransferase domain